MLRRAGAAVAVAIPSAYVYLTAAYDMPAGRAQAAAADKYAEQLRLKGAVVLPANALNEDRWFVPESAAQIARTYWKEIRMVLQRFWRASAFEDIDIDDLDTWPTAEELEERWELRQASTLRARLAPTPKLLGDDMNLWKRSNGAPQLVLQALLDPDDSNQRRVHFGSGSHRYVRLAVSPLWYWLPWFGPPEDTLGISLHEQGWRAPAFPTKAGKEAMKARMDEQRRAEAQHGATVSSNGASDLAPLGWRTMPSPEDAAGTWADPDPLFQAGSALRDAGEEPPSGAASLKLPNGCQARTPHTSAGRPGAVLMKGALPQQVDSTLGEALGQSAPQVVSAAAQSLGARAPSLTSSSSKPKATTTSGMTPEERVAWYTLTCLGSVVASEAPCAVEVEQGAPCVHLRSHLVVARALRLAAEAGVEVSHDGLEAALRWWGHSERVAKRVDGLAPLPVQLRPGELLLTLGSTVRHFVWPRDPLEPVEGVTDVAGVAYPATPLVWHEATAWFPYRHPRSRKLEPVQAEFEQTFRFLKATGGVLVGDPAGPAIEEQAKAILGFLEKHRS